MNAADEDGNTVLHTLLQHFPNEHQNRLMSLRLLLAAGASVNTRNVEGKTAVTDILQRKGANLHVLLARNRERKTAVAHFTKRDVGWPYESTVLDLFYTAGGHIGEVTEVRSLRPESESELCFKHLCREAIRNNLLEHNATGNLFVKVKKLGLPAVLGDYLLYHLSVDENDNARALISHYQPLLTNDLSLNQDHLYYIYMLVHWVPFTTSSLDAQQECIPLGCVPSSVSGHL